MSLADKRLPGKRLVKSPLIGICITQVPSAGVIYNMLISKTNKDTYYFEYGMLIKIKPSSPKIDSFFHFLSTHEPKMNIEN